MQNADAILEAARSDTRSLSEVEKMNLADGMLGSGKDSGVSGIDDTLEELRWYVYQQECVDALRDGLEQVPFTMDDDALLGGVLRQHVDDESVDMESEEVYFNSQPQQESLMNTVPMPSLLSFQEGEHMGEASFEEIKAGFDDGELSGECVVFHHAQDDWIPIEEFIKQYEDNLSGESANSSRKRDLSAMKEVSVVQSTNGEESPSCEGIHSMKIHTASEQSESPNCTVLAAAAEKREKKKPSRDNSQWGQCSAPHIKSIQESSAADEKKSGSPNPDISMSDASPKDNMSKRSKKKKLMKPPPKMMRFITQVCFQWIHLLNDHAAKNLNL